MELPVIEVSGNSYEIGFQHGQKAKKQIDVVVGIYKDMFYEYSHITWDMAKKIALTFEDSIRAFHADYIEEIKGIADGSGYEYAEILAMNVRSELVFQGTHLTSDGCTSMVVTADHTDKAGTYLGQNWDWKVKTLEGAILLKIKKEGVPAIATMTEAGIIGKIGMNENGIGVCFNALSVDDTPTGVPIHIILRNIMEQKTLVEAMQVVTNTQIGCPANILVASSTEALDFEVEIDDFETIYPTDGIITHTNHYTTIRLPRMGRRDMARRKFPDTFIRKGCADKLIRSVKRPITIEDMKMVFTSHCDRSCAICHHEEENRESSGGIGTVFSIIMDLQNREFYVSFGQPCEHPYLKYNV